jgi:hypothetical protein
MRDVCSGKVHKAADCKGRVISLWEQKIKETIGVFGIDFEKPQV